MGHGSGVLFTRAGETFIWTAAHVAEHFMNSDGSFSEIMVIRGRRTAKARVIRCGDAYVTHDLALLQITEGGLKGGARFYKAFNEVELGQEIIHCGAPFNVRLNGNLLFFGHVSHIGRMMSIPFFILEREVDQCDVNAHPGCSGGPIFDAKTGDILGLLSLGGEPGLTAIVPTRIIYEWAKSHDCLWAFDPKVPLPESIVAWRADKLDREIAVRDTTEVDERWGGE
jgi:S1-C subfamily serine protease